MKAFKSLWLLFLAVSLISCGGDEEDGSSAFSIELSDGKTTFQLLETIQAGIAVTGGAPIDSVVYYLEEKRLQKSVGNKPLEYTFENDKLGKWNLTARVYTPAEDETLKKEIILYNDQPPVTYTYEVVNTFPHATDAYTQGLEFYEGELYESTGHYGESSLRKVDLETGEVLKSKSIPPQFFAEGITILDDKIYQLTWKEGKGFIYDVDTFDKIAEFGYHQSEEGWGLANDGKNLYKSDGTEKIWILDPETVAEQNFVQTVTDKTIATKLNELEWVEGRIYANTYQKDGVAIINPENGAIEGVINFQGLRDQLANQEDLDPVNDVLNGIAYNPATQKLYVTGKNWDTLFEVVIKKQ